MELDGFRFDFDRMGRIPVDENALSVTVKRLRGKLEDNHSDLNTKGNTAQLHPRVSAVFLSNYAVLPEINFFFPDPRGLDSNRLTTPFRN
mgnify:CR=1 FL=1